MLYQIDKMIFCGDVLFPMSVGRNDLPTGNIVSLTDSLKRIKKMEHDIMMYPGHDEVFVLSDALKFNPYLK
jgi:glyoxylase-like metal-dependent hydrolase (beta-lactamase superfamily II)